MTWHSRPRTPRRAEIALRLGSGSGGGQCTARRDSLGSGGHVSPGSAGTPTARAPTLPPRSAPRAQGSSIRVRGRAPAAGRREREGLGRQGAAASGCCCGHETEAEEEGGQRGPPVDAASVGAEPTGRGWGPLPARCSSPKPQMLAAGRVLMQEERQAGPTPAPRARGDLPRLTPVQGNQQPEAPSCDLTISRLN